MADVVCGAGSLDEDDEDDAMSFLLDDANF